jgi:hypothetical protein
VTNLPNIQKTCCESEILGIFFIMTRVTGLGEFSPNVFLLLFTILPLFTIGSVPKTTEALYAHFSSTFFHGTSYLCINFDK